MNSIAITGNLCADPDMHETQSGAKVANFRLAVRRPHVADTTDFISCVAWRHNAEYLCKYAHKGDRIAVSGCLTSRKYTAQDGAEHTVWEVIADNVEAVSKAPGASQNGAGGYGDGLAY